MQQTSAARLGEIHAAGKCQILAGECRNLHVLCKQVYSEDAEIFRFGRSLEDKSSVWSLLAFCTYPNIVS